MANMKSVFEGKSIAVTGKLDNYTRASIQTRLLELGAHSTSFVSRKTDFLLVGTRAGSKLDKARALGVTILTESDFEKVIGRKDGTNSPISNRRG